MRTQSMDTSPEAERVQIELLRKASPAKKFAIVSSLSQLLIEASRRNIRQVHPDVSEEEVHLISIERYSGKEPAERMRLGLERKKQG